MQKYCYACEVKLKCVMDYTDIKRQEQEKVYCPHLSKGDDKETCSFYMVAKKDRKEN